MFSGLARLQCRAAGASQPLAKKACCSPSTEELEFFSWESRPWRGLGKLQASMPGRWRGPGGGEWMFSGLALRTRRILHGFCMNIETCHFDMWFFARFCTVFACGTACSFSHVEQLA